MGQNKIAGIYKITNTISGDFYIGSSCNIEKRWREHRSPSVHKQRPNSKLYKAMAKYGLDNFIFEILEETADLKEREQYYIEQLKPSYNNFWAKGQDAKRRKEWYKIHRDERLAKMEEWRKSHRNELLTYKKAYNYTHRDEHLAKSKDYYSRLCLYNGETLTLSALRARFGRQGIPHPTLEAKKYLL